MMEPNAQYNVARPDSLSVRIATQVRTRMFDAFLREFAPVPSETILDVGVTSDQSTPHPITWRRCTPTRTALPLRVSTMRASWKRCTPA